MRAGDIRATGNGGAERNRTADLLIANEALSQLSYGPGACAKMRRSRLLGGGGRGVKRSVAGTNLLLNPSPVAFTCQSCQMNAGPPAPSSGPPFGLPREARGPSGIT